MNNNYRFGGSGGGGAGGVADGRQERVKLLFANRQRVVPGEHFRLAQKHLGVFSA
jgi:hypothetical protein